MPDAAHFKYPGDSTVYDVMDETARSGIDTLNTEVAGKAPTDHASSATTYGRATGSVYGHAKVINNLTTSSHTNGYALSAYQGYLLKQEVDEKVEDADYVHTDNNFTDSLKDKLDGSATQSGTYNGLTITLYRNCGCVTCYIRGTTTAAMATGSAYVTLFTPSDASWMPKERMISYHIITATGFRGQVNPSTTNIQLGYTKTYNGTASDTPAGTAIYCMLTWAAK